MVVCFGTLCEIFAVFQRYGEIESVLPTIITRGVTIQCPVWTVIKWCIEME